MSVKKITTYSTAAQSRRSFIKQMGFALAAAPLVGIVACGGGSTESATTSTDTTTGSGSSGGSTGSSGTWATGGTAALTGVALARQADARAVVDAGGNLEVQGAILADLAVTVAGGAGIGDHLTLAVAAGAGALDLEEAVGLAHASRAAAGTAGCRPARGRRRP